MATLSSGQTAEALDELEPSTVLNRQALVSILGRIREFKGFSKTQLIRIARQKVVYWGPDEFIIREGLNNQDQMFILLAGKVYVQKKVEKDSAVSYEQMAEIMGPSIFGENSFFTGLARSAAIYARERTPGIVLNREDFMRLISLDKSTVVGFLKHMASENLQRAERTLVLYMGTLQLILKDASISKLSYYHMLNTMSAALTKKSSDVEMWTRLVRDIMLFIRELNNTLQDLYLFANQPELKIVSVDFKKFSLSKAHRFYIVFRTLVEDLYQTQQLVPLNSVNFKDSFLSAVMTTMEQGIHFVDYPKIISISNEAYGEFLAIHKELGFDLLREVKAANIATQEEEKKFMNLLWESF
ncbi:MAG: cyclic nucleotide-binding domain-containing protein [Nitrospinae bacterium]|nr:cyclic nucleotide-binding domain-containing protein [Nitrospinota bacterium]